MADAAVVPEPNPPSSVTHDVEINSETAFERLAAIISKLQYVRNPNVRVPLIEHDGLLNLLSKKDEIVLIERTELPQYYVVWSDIPNRSKYILRNPAHFITFSDLHSMLNALLDLFIHRAALSHSYLREPERLTLRLNRTHLPSSIGFPTPGLLDDFSDTDQFRALVEGASSSQRVCDGVIKLKCLGDKHVLTAAARLFDYALNDMPRFRTRTDNQLKELSLLTHTIPPELNIKNGHELFYPVFDPCLVQGPFDEFSKASQLRLQFCQLAVAPLIRYSPISTSDLIKESSQNAAKASFISDIAARSWKSSYNEMYQHLVMSYISPSDIIFDLDFLSSSQESCAVRGFAAVLARVLLMYSRKGIYCNTSPPTQTAIDNAIIAWGVASNALTRNDPINSYTFPLNNYQLSRANAAESRAFDGLKILSNRGGCIGAQDLFLIRNDHYQESYYPDIVPRHRIAVDVDSFSAHLNDPSIGMRWAVAEGARVFLRKLSGGNAYVGIFNKLVDRMMNWFVRLNEYNAANWCTTFRRSAMSLARLTPDKILNEAVRIPMKIDFILTVVKGLDAELWEPSTTIVDRLRFEGAFAREANFAYYLHTLTTTFQNEVNDSRSFTSRNRNELICSKSPLFNYLFSILTPSDEDSKLVTMLQRYYNLEFPLTQCYDSLLLMDVDTMHMYGVLCNVIIHTI